MNLLIVTWFLSHYISRQEGVSPVSVCEAFLVLSIEIPDTKASAVKPGEETVLTSCPLAIQEHRLALSAKNTVPLLFRIGFSIIYHFDISSQRF